MYVVYIKFAYPLCKLQCVNLLFFLENESKQNNTLMNQ